MKQLPLKLEKTKYSIVNKVDLSEEDALSLIVNGFCKEVFKELPFEFAVEAERLIEMLVLKAVLDKSSKF